MKIFFVTLILGSISILTNGQTTLGEGRQPQITADAAGVIRVVFGKEDKIYYATSTNQGATFSSPIFVAQVPGMHLGMTRGPQLATSHDVSMITAMDKAGNIHSFIHHDNQDCWQESVRVNDVEGSAPEGLMAIAANDDGYFFAVWLDLRHQQQNNICFASFNNGKWSANKFVYTSPDGHTCECCKPSIIAQKNTVAIMFRNWLLGARDLYYINSVDRGQTFSPATKLGDGTWPLQGCPMDGGGLSFDDHKNVRTAWQREGIVYTAQPGKRETKIGEGRHVTTSGDVVAWENGSALMIANSNTAAATIGAGKALAVVELPDGSTFAAWENDGMIVGKKF